MTNYLLQICIAGFTGTGLWLTASDHWRRQRLGFSLCLLGQPFWFIDTIRHEQWGMLALTIWLTAAFAKGWWARRLG